MPTPDAPPLGWVPNLTSRSVDTERILDIVHTPMTHRQRNDLVTVAYQDLSDAMAKVIGSRDASWCTYSQWPSSTVRLMVGTPIPLLHEGIERAFGFGNRGVFSDIGQAYVAFIETVGEADPKDFGDVVKAMEACAGRLAVMVPAPGKPVFDLSAADLDGLATGATKEMPTEQSVLFNGLFCYALSLIQDTDHQRAELIYAGSVLLAAHEQLWLDEALSAGFRVPIRRLLHPRLNLLSQHEFRRTEIAAGPLLAVEETIIHLLTRFAVGFWFNGKWVPVGLPLPNVRGPKDLDRADNPNVGDVDEPAIVFLADVVRRFPQRPSTKCWLSFHQRMRFIARLFRQHQQDVIQHPIDDETATRLLQEAQARVLSEPRLPRPSREIVPDSQLAELRQRVDGVADEVVRPLLKDRDPFEPLKLVAHTFLVADVEEPAKPAPVADPFPLITADCNRRWGELVERGLIDAETIRRATDFYAANGIVINASLLFASLPDSYAAAKGVKVLGEASRLGSDPVRRTGETTNFLIDVTRGDLATAGSRGRRAIVGVRGFHAIVRWMIEERGGWDEAQLGRPANQEDLLGTALTFIVPVFEALDQVGIASTRRDRDAYTSLWCAIGYLLGVELEELTRSKGPKERFLTHKEAVVLSAQIRYRQRARSLEGTLMLAALMEDVADYFPRALRHLPALLLRYVGDDAVAAVLMAPQGDSELMRGLLATVRGVMVLPGVHRLMPAVVRKASEGFLESFGKQGFTDPYMSPLDERPPPEPRSRIPVGCLDDPRAPQAVAE